ncbi:hypothetical protein BCR39DRAFT_524815 [Naematelia encephala]|uniref:OTU domain-containing protein n=1 Tax=Naematelia encephala TaxID=71784 RepID=A0A1Y2BAX7_9TREE|nr:hypothetical protein BCR39DRAFT_524815 [Naematelia encephala]
MPGSKRRALKNLLSPESKPTSSPPPLNDSPSSIAIPTLSSSPISGSSPTDQSTISLPSSIGGGGGGGSGSGDKEKKHSHHFHLPHFNGHGHGSRHGNGNGRRSSIEQANLGSVMSINSDPGIGEYQSDENQIRRNQTIDQALIVDEMQQREHSIGSHGQRIQDGIAGLSVSPSPISTSTSPAPPTPSSPKQIKAHMQQAGAAQTAAAQGGMYGAKPATGPAAGGGGRNGGGGGLYAPAGAVPVTANELLGNGAGSGNGNGTGGRGKKKSSRQKFEERQARKREALLHSAPPSDPGWTAQLEKERQDEIRIISDACAVLGREIYEIAPDGHCMFNAIADQLYQVGMIPAHQATNPLHLRRTAAQYMLAHPDDFMPFLPSINGEDAAGATDDGLITEKEFKSYCRNVEETGEWGGEPEIQALSRHYNIPIHVIQRGPPTIVSHGGNNDTFGGVLTPEQSASQGDRVVRISYHKRMYGLGEHYNSLRKAE